MFVGLIFGVWIGPAWLAAKHAQKKGYSFGGFFVLGLFVSWIISWAVALILDDRGARGPTTFCPECAETILAAARVCKHCGHRLEPAVSGPAS